MNIKQNLNRKLYKNLETLYKIAEYYNKIKDYIIYIY